MEGRGIGAGERKKWRGRGDVGGSWGADEKGMEGEREREADGRKMKYLFSLSPASGLPHYLYSIALTGDNRIL